MVFENLNPIAAKCLTDKVSALCIASSMVKDPDYHTICRCELARTLLKMPRW